MFECCECCEWWNSTASFKFRIAILISAVFFPVFVVCQQSNQIESKYHWFDGLIGETNSGLFEGQAYYDIYNVKDGRHQFLNTAQFKTGSVTYKGQEYFNVALRYDIFNDNLIVRNKQVYWVPPMIFDTELLTNFSIGNSEFKNFKETISDDDTGFFEIILRSNSYTLLKKHKKKLFVKIQDDILYHEFKDDFTYYLRVETSHIKLKSIKELNSIYPEHKKSIKLLEKKYKSAKKSDFGGYLKSILIDLQKELPTSNKMQQ